MLYNNGKQMKTTVWGLGFRDIIDNQIKWKRRMDNGMATRVAFWGLYWGPPY